MDTEDYQTSTFVQQQQLWQTGRLFITSPTRSRRRINQLFLHHCSQHSQMQSGDIFVSENVIRSLVKGESGRHIGTSRNMGALAWECTIQQGSLCLMIGIWHRHILRISQYMRISKGKSCYGHGSIWPLDVYFSFFSLATCALFRAFLTCTYFASHILHLKA